MVVTVAHTSQRWCAAGTTIEAQLRTALDSRRAHVGQPLIAVVTRNAHCGNHVVIATGSELLGRVTAVSRASDENSRSSVGVVFFEASTPGGARLQLRAGITRVLSADSNGGIRTGDVLDAASRTSIAQLAEGATGSEATIARTDQPTAAPAEHRKLSLQFPAAGNVPASAGGTLSEVAGDVQLANGTRIELTVAEQSDTSTISF
jgi:hypothetical protein